MSASLPAVWMRGGTSKGLFFHRKHLPEDETQRNRLLIRALGSPDPYAKQMDGLGGATSSTSKIVIISPSARADCDVDYFFGHVAITQDKLDTSGNCGNLTAAVGPFAIDEGLVTAVAPMTMVRIWQANIGKRIVAHVPVADGRAQTLGDFSMDGVAFPGAAIDLVFKDVGGGAQGDALPTGNVVDTLDIPEIGTVQVSLINAGNAAVFVRAVDLGLTGTETPGYINKHPEIIARLQTVRAHATVAMGLAHTPEQAEEQRPATPKIHWLGPPVDHSLDNGKSLTASEIDLCARALSMGQAHHAYPGTSAIATAVAAAIPGTLANQMQQTDNNLRIGHAAGRLEVSAEVAPSSDNWAVPAVRLQRSARRLMRGELFLP